MIWMVWAKWMKRGGVPTRSVTHSWEPYIEQQPVPPECPGECGCRWRTDADRADCGCDGGCCTEAWDVLPDGTPRPDLEYIEIYETMWLP